MDGPDLTLLNSGGQIYVLQSSPWFTNGDGGGGSADHG